MPIIHIHDHPALPPTPPAIRVLTSYNNEGLHVGALSGNCRAGRAQPVAESIACKQTQQHKQPAQTQLHACPCAGPFDIPGVRVGARSLLRATVTPGKPAGGRYLVRLKCEPVSALGNLGNPGVHVGALRRARRGHAGRVERVAEHEVQVVRALRDQHRDHGGRQVAQHAPAMPARATSHLCHEARMLPQSTHAIWVISEH